MPDKFCEDNETTRTILPSLQSAVFVARNSELQNLLTTQAIFSSTQQCAHFTESLVCGGLGARSGHCPTFLVQLVLTLLRVFTNKPKERPTCPLPTSSFPHQEASPHSSPNATIVDRLFDSVCPIAASFGILLLTLVIPDMNATCAGLCALSRRSAVAEWRVRPSSHRDIASLPCFPCPQSTRCVCQLQE